MYLENLKEGEFFRFEKSTDVYEIIKKHLHSVESRKLNSQYAKFYAPTCTVVRVKNPLKHEQKKRNENNPHDPTN